MSRLWAVLLCACAGCNLVEIPESDHGGGKPAAETVWTCLADEIDANTIDDSDELLLIVNRLRDRSRITDADVSKFNETFDGLKKEGGCRKLTPDDAKRMRGL